MAKRRSPLRKRSHSPTIGLLSRVFAGLAGYDLKMFAKHSGDDFDHERRKLVSVGVAVLIPSCLAFFAAHYFSGAYFDNPSTRVLIASFASLLILVIDAIIVSTVSRHSVSGVLVRVAMSVMMGYLIAEPLALAMFHETIHARNIEQLNTARTQREKTLNEALTRDQAEWDNVQERMSKAQERLKEHSPERLLMQHLNEAVARKHQVRAAILQGKEAEAQRLSATRAELEKQRSSKQAELHQKLLDMDRERRGEAASGRKGEGPIYKQLTSESERLNQELETINDGLQVIDGQIHRLHRDRAQGKDIDSTLGGADGPSPLPGSYELTVEELAAKQRIETEISDYSAKLKSLGERIHALRGEIAELPKTFAPSTRDDLLAQTRILYELLQENWLMRAIVTAFLMWYFLIDVTPLIAKLSVKTTYDDCLRSIARQRMLKRGRAYDAFHDSTFQLGLARRRRLYELGVRLLEDLRSIGPADSVHIRAAHAEVARLLRREFDETVARFEATQPLESSRMGLFSLLIAALKNAWWLLRTKFSS